MLQKRDTKKEKKMPFHPIIDSLMNKHSLKNATDIDFRIKFHLKIILSFISLLPQVNIHYRWKTIQTGCYDLVKGDQDCLIEVTA